MKSHLATGRAGEQIAAAHLRSKGYRILQRNWRFRRAEVDIIAARDQWLVFCEVKTRTSTLYGAPETFVKRRKMALMLDAAIEYREIANHTGEIRFDILAVVLKNEREFSVKHFEDAFFPGLEGF